MNGRDMLMAYGNGYFANLQKEIFCNGKRSRTDADSHISELSVYIQLITG